MYQTLALEIVAVFLKMTSVLDNQEPDRYIFLPLLNVSELAIRLAKHLSIHH